LAALEANYDYILVDCPPSLGLLTINGLVAAREGVIIPVQCEYLALEGLGQLTNTIARVRAALHPGLRLDPAPPAPPAARGPDPCTVLFLCTGNSARSQAAEALAQARSGGRVQAFSAGSHPKPLHPHAVQVMAERGIDLAGQRPKHLSAFAGRGFNYVITLCDRVREVCPEFPGHPGYLHWSIPDPAAAGGSEEDTYPAFEQMAAELETRIGFWLSVAGVAPAPASLQEA